ncbi:hypothetical protein, partial [Aneurinibacillus aneurinilyticus]|uniref:hypothetical protein n=1 Tax=Aneurinibacillus aneurinilyticus TaxID=1391 RepID=UPI00197B6DA0
RTDARLGHGVVTTHSGSYWIINTLDKITQTLMKSYHIASKPGTTNASKGKNALFFLYDPQKNYAHHLEHHFICRGSCIPAEERPVCLFPTT